MTDETKDPTDLLQFGTITGVAERPTSLDRHDLTGTDDDPNEIKFPRLAIAQGLSHQITPGDARFIRGLTLFDMFNDLTEEVYGKGPLTFVPVRRDIRRMEFRPRTEGGGLIDPNVPPGDNRLEWRRGEGPNGEDLPPTATTFVEFVILLLKSRKPPEPIVLSIAGTNKENRRASDRLRSFISFRGSAIYSGLYTICTEVPAKNDKGTFGVPTIKNAGFIPVDTPAGEALYRYAKEFHQRVIGKEITLEERDTEENVEISPSEVPF